MSQAEEIAAKTKAQKKVASSCVRNAAIPTMLILNFKNCEDHLFNLRLSRVV